MPEDAPIYIVSAARTPFGRHLGALKERTAVDLALIASAAALHGLAKPDIDQVILGSVLGAGQGMNPARQLAMRLGLPLATPGFTVNSVCASGLQTVCLAAQALRAGTAEVVLCGGAESMSHAAMDTILRDGLTDPFCDEHMGLTAERLAFEFGIPRTAQDAYAVESQRRCAAAEASGRFNAERIGLPELAKDEHPRPGTLLEKLAMLKPAFMPEGSVTAGNSSGINDGAAMLVLATESACHRHGWMPMAQIGRYALVGCDPLRMGLGPVAAIRQLEAKGLKLTDVDVFELNEAFAVQALACIQSLKLPPESVNPHGGAIALGHPIGASGARLATHLARRIAMDEVGLGVAALCVGAGMGIALELKRA